MPRIKYVRGYIRPQTRQKFDATDRILRHYSALGIKLSLPQLYLRMVVEGYYPHTHVGHISCLNMINRALMLGQLDWDHISDSVTADDYAPNHYRVDPWIDQPNYVELWCGPAVTMSLSKTLDKWRLRSVTMRCNVGSGAVWNASRRMRTAIEAGQKPIVLAALPWSYFGCVIYPETFAQLQLFVGLDVEIRRIFINEEHFPNAVRSATYNQRKRYRSKFNDKFGVWSYDLPGLEPEFANTLLDDAMKGLVDQDRWDAALEREKVLLENKGEA